MAQLVAHLHGMQGVRGSSPLSSTKYKDAGSISCVFCVSRPHLGDQARSCHVRYGEEQEDKHELDGKRR